MSKMDFYQALSIQEREFFEELNKKLGPCKYEGEQAPEGVVIKDVKPETPYRCYWRKG